MSSSAISSTKKLLLKLEKIIFNMNDENLDMSISQSMKLFDPNYPHSFNFTIKNLVYYAICSHMNGIDKYMKYLESIQIEEERINNNLPKIMEIFTKFITNNRSQETLYIINHMFERNLVDITNIKKMKSQFFMHYIEKGDYDYTFGFFSNNLKELSNNDWELHKKYIKEGHNPNEIAKIIRNDEIEKFQEISSQTNFDFNQKIEPSPYERYSFINQDDVTLIDYAAFFGSVKCFKYLLMNNANVNKTGKYAVAGGNEEIIYLCEQNHSSFEGAYEAAMKFHRNDIFKYLYENDIVEVNDLEKLILKCISYHNYEILFYLEEKIKITLPIIEECVEIGNLYIVKEFLYKINYIPNDILIIASKSGNVELVKYIIDQKIVDINETDIHI